MCTDMKWDLRGVQPCPQASSSPPPCSSKNMKRALQAPQALQLSLDSRLCHPQMIALHVDRLSAKNQELQPFVCELAPVLCPVLVARSCLIPCDPMDCSRPGSSVHADSPGKNTGVDCRALLQGIFPAST